MRSRPFTGTRFVQAVLLGLVLVATSGITYEYDNLNRLTRVTYDDGSQIRFEYDPVGNRSMRIINNDCAPEVAEIQLFVSEMLSPAPDPLYLCQFDLNQDGEINALDIGPFVEEILQP